MDEVVCNWLSMLVGGEGGPYGWGREVLHCDSFFYVDYDLVTSTDSEWPKGAFYTLACFFDRVRLQTKVRNKFGMLCHP